MTAPTYEELTGPERAAADAYTARTGGELTEGVLHAVRAAIAHLESSEDARLAYAEMQVAQVRDALVRAGFAGLARPGVPLGEAVDRLAAALRWEG